MANTTNFGWETPDDTDLVKDGALAMRTLGNAIDTSLVDLKGGTTGQVLSKTSNTDMDFTWVTSDDANAIQNAIVDAKGDLITATAADTPARLAVGSNGDTLVADSAASTGLRWQGNYAAGKNKIINGDFGIWQRGTSFTSPADATYTADRFQLGFDGTITTHTFSQQTFTPGTAPVAGYEGQFFARWAITTNGTSTFRGIRQKIEDVRTFAGQTVTFSFWAKAASNLTLSSVQYSQAFGSGGSSANDKTITMNSLSVTTSWQRFTGTVTIDGVSGKTIGTSSSLAFIIYLPATGTLDVWGWQVEAGSVATAFQTATGTLQGELAACQRYYYRLSPAASGAVFGTGFVNGATEFRGVIPFPIQLRTAPTALEQSGTAADYAILTSGTTVTTCSGVPTFSTANPNAAAVNLTVASGLTSGQGGHFRAATTSAYLGWSAEL